MHFGSKDHITFLDNLKVGDEVSYEIPTWSRSNYVITTIAKITPKRSFVTANGTRFTPRGIHMVDDYHWYYLMPNTDEIKTRMAQMRLSSKAKALAAKIDYNSLSIEQLNKIIPVLEGIINDSRIGD